MSALLRSWSCILKPPALPMPRIGGGGSAMMKASWMLCRLPNRVADDLARRLAGLQPLVERLEPGEDHAGIAGVGEGRAGEAGEGDRIVDARRLLDDLRRLLDHRVGARQRGAVGQLDDDDRIALVERRDEAARHRLHHVDRGVDEAGENRQHARRALSTSRPARGRCCEYPCASLSKPRLKPSASARPNRARKKRGGAADAWCGLNSSAASAGESVSELKAEIAVDTAMVIANCR